MFNNKENNQNVRDNYGTYSGRDTNYQTIINQDVFKSDSIVEGIKQITTYLDNKVKLSLPDGIYNKRKSKHENFSSEKLLTSLLEIAIPIPVAFDLLALVPEKISQIIDEGKQEVSTTEIRRIIYNGICSLAYIEHGHNINKWGTNYSRKYGNPDAQIMIITDKNEEIPLDFNIVTKELIPDLIQKCYGEDYSYFLENSNNNKLISTCAAEIIDKIRSLNVYKIRYGTIHKIAYDLATHPPHPWFTNKELKEGHKKYHFERLTFHFNNLSNFRNFYYSFIEFIEHSCAYLLTEYSLFVGNDKLRPLHLLLSYLKIDLKDEGNLLMWEGSDLNKLKGDLRSIECSLSLFERLLSNIRHHTSKQFKENKKDIIKNDCKDLYDLIQKHKINIDKLKSDCVFTYKSFIEYVDFLFIFLDDIAFRYKYFYYQKNRNKKIKVVLYKVFQHPNGKFQFDREVDCESDCSLILFVSNIPENSMLIEKIEEEIMNKLDYAIINIANLKQIMNDSNRIKKFIKHIQDCKK